MSPVVFRFPFAFAALRKTQDLLAFRLAPEVQDHLHNSFQQIDPWKLWGDPTKTMGKPWENSDLMDYEWDQLIGFCGNNDRKCS